MMYREKLEREERYDGCCDADYETRDYFAESDDAGEEAQENGCVKKRRQRNCGISCETEEDFYSAQVDVQRGEVARKKYAQLAETARNGSEEEKKRDRKEACFYMKGLVRRVIGSKFHTYIEKDFYYREDLEQEAYCNIIKYLPRYDPKKGLPSTYFMPHIKSAMVGVTNRMKHFKSNADIALIHKITKVREAYAKNEREPGLDDFVDEIGETHNRIKAVLVMMDRGVDTHLDAIEDYDALCAGDAAVDSTFESPEKLVIDNVSFEGLINRKLKKDEEILKAYECFC